MDRDFVVGEQPLEVSAKEPINVADAFNCNEFCQELFKSKFDLRVFREVNEVINIDTKGKGCHGGRCCWVGWINKLPVKRHGSNALSLIPRLLRIVLIFVYQ